MNRAELERRARLWQRHRAIRAAWLASATGLFAASMVWRLSVAGAIITGVTVLMSVAVLLRRREHSVTAETIAKQLNRLCPTLEESAGLWLRDSHELTLVESLQLRRLDAAWHTLPDRATLACPRRSALRPAAALFAASSIAVVTAIVWPRSSEREPIVVQTTPNRSGPTSVVVTPTLRNARLEISPPEYLGAATRRVEGLDAEVAEGSVVTWDLAFTGEITGVSLIVANAKERVLAETVSAGRFRARATIVDTQIYQLALTQADGSSVILPELHTIKAIRDQPPRLTWREPASSRTVVDPVRGRPSVAVQLGAVDDHGIAEVHLVMTVAKGSGENIKFREQEIALERTPGAAADGDTFGCILDLITLGLQPGDELYFHAVATDRRMPAPNRARSETRFVVLRGPETEISTQGIALAGINRLPQYFRSQRQLIIDTERLVAERAALPEETFRARSEDIGVDQKLLRLRYGQFLGEEFEPAASGAPKEARAMAMAGALRGQPREAQSRAAAVERAVEAQHAHAPVSEREGRPLTFEEIIAPFTHVHDSVEAATLFDAHVKTALRAVLATMWEAEGFLRTARPADALPAENRALELLKALQQADRVYVKRVGYESAPIKIDERRLRGELDSIPKRAQASVPHPPKDADAVALANAVAAFSEAAMAPVPPDTAVTVEMRLVAAAQEQPEIFVAALELWRRGSTALTATERAIVRQALSSLLPPAAEMPGRREESASSLARVYFEALSSNADRPR